MIAGDFTSMYDIAEGNVPVMRVYAGDELVWERPGSEGVNIAVFSSEDGESVPGAEQITGAAYKVYAQVSQVHDIAIVPNRYLWVCVSAEDFGVSSSGFEVPCVDYGAVRVGSESYCVKRLAGRPQSDSIILSVNL